MSKLIRYVTSRLFLILLFSTFFIQQSSGQSSLPENMEYLEPGFYTVVGAFKYPENADKRLAQMAKIGERSNSGFYPPRGLIYVEIGKFNSFQAALDKALIMQSRYHLDSTWAFEALPYALKVAKVVEKEIPEVEVIPLPLPAVVVVVEEEEVKIPDASIGVVFDTRTDTAYIKRVVAGSPSMAMGLLPGDKILEVNNQVATGTFTNDIAQKLLGFDGTPVDMTILRDDQLLELQVDRRTLVSGTLLDRSNPGKFSGTKGQIVEYKMMGKVVYFNTIQAGSYIEVPGQIEIVDGDSSIFKNSHQVIGIPMEVNGSGDISLISEILGYKKIQHDINLLNPINEGTKDFLSFEDSILVVNFELKPYTMGDIATIYNIYFFRDAAIMKPESKYEIEQLLNMLRSNTNYRIKLMGHTNGNHKGPIIEMSKGSTDYFAEDGPTVESWGSAKELSQKRANLIRDYLITQGIAGDRMETVGHGGKKSLYKKFDELAYKNVRVEIEILQY